MKAIGIYHRNVLDFAAIVLISVTIASCRNKEMQEVKRKHYQTMVISSSNRVLETHYPAVIRGRQHVEIRPQINGTITEIRIREGAIVRKGETLFVIDQAPYLAALKTAVANVKSAEAKWANARLAYDGKAALREKEIVSDFDLQATRNALLEAEATLEQAKAQQELAEANLAYTEIKSPVNGVASMTSYRVGALIGNAMTEPLITVSDDEEVHAYFSMTENQVLDMNRQQSSLVHRTGSDTEVWLRLSDGSMYGHTGEIDAVSGTIDSGTGSISVRATFPNPERVLRNGGTGQVVLTTPRDHCIVIPQSATYEIQNRIFVYKIVDGRATATTIEVEDTNNGKEYIVTSGLKEGDTIISEGAGLVQEGTIVSNP